MSLRNSDFPDYKGVRTVHIDFDPQQYHSHQPRPSIPAVVEPPTPKPKPIPVSKPEPLIDKALAEDLKQRNLKQ